MLRHVPKVAARAIAWHLRAVGVLGAVGVDDKLLLLPDRLDERSLLLVDVRLLRLLVLLREPRLLLLTSASQALRRKWEEEDSGEL